MYVFSIDEVQPLSLPVNCDVMKGVSSGRLSGPGPAALGLRPGTQGAGGCTPEEQGRHQQPGESHALHRGQRPQMGWGGAVRMIELFYLHY